MAALPGNYDIRARVGHVFHLPLTYDQDENGTPVNLTGYSAQLIARQSRNGGLIVALSDGNGITVDAESGEIELYAAATTTEGWTSRTGVYDLNLIPPSGAVDTFTLLTGRFIIEPRVKPDGGSE